MNEKTEMDGGEMTNVWGGGGGAISRGPHIDIFIFIYIYILAHENYTFCFSDLDRTIAEIL